MALTMWLSCAVLVSMVAALPMTTVPNQCPTTPEPYPTFYGHPDDCQYYFMCDNGKPHLLKCSEKTRWSDVYKVCVGYNTHFDTCTKAKALRECVSDPSALIPHPTACQRYYNCSNSSPPSQFRYLQQYEEECPYPQVFDVNELKCRPYTEAYCGRYRVSAKDPCEYLKNLCGSAHCEPCGSRMPSCAGRSDGNHEHPLRLWTPYYITCKDERLVVDPARRSCEKHAKTEFTALFSPVKKQCVSLWEVPRENGGLAPTCDGKTSGQAYRSDERPDVYYSCPGVKVSYCGLGNIFNESNQQCESSK